MILQKGQLLNPAEIITLKKHDLSLSVGSDKSSGKDKRKIFDNQKWIISIYLPYLGYYNIVVSVCNFV
jgi:hypothetical protein